MATMQTVGTFGWWPTPNTSSVGTFGWWLDEAAPAALAAEGVIDLSILVFVGVI